MFVKEVDEKTKEGGGPPKKKARLDDYFRDEGEESSESQTSATGFQTDALAENKENAGDESCANLQNSRLIICYFFRSGDVSQLMQLLMSMLNLEKSVCEKCDSNSFSQRYKYITENLQFGSGSITNMTNNK